MNTKHKEQLKELQANYKEMLESIEEYVVKEGKTLQQAFHAAEQKLDDTKEISKQKISQISRDLKDRFRIYGEAIEGVSEAYKEQIEFDLDYMSSSLWDKFQSIAKSNSVELQQFIQTLQEKAQSTLTDEHISDHQEHTQWNSDHALWLDEITLWEKEHTLALTKLNEIEKVMQKQSATLLEHAQAIKTHTDSDHEHEKAMAKAEKDPSSEVFKSEDEKEVSVHQQKRQLHTQQSELHQALKSHHLKIMALVNMLSKEISKNE